MKAKIDKYLGYLLMGLMLLMTLDVLYGVLTRYLVGSQASWTEELARFLLIWIGILGAAYAASKQMHLAIDLLKPRLNKEQQKRVFFVINLLVMLFALTAMVIGGFRLMYITQVLGQLSAALRLPMYMVYSVVPLSGLLIMYFKAHELWKYSS